MIFNVSLLLVVLSVAWADIHFLLAVFRAGHWWDVIPLIGMEIVTYCLGWFFAKAWEVRDLGRIHNLFINLGTLLRLAKGHPRGQEFLSRLTLPPEEFKRELRPNVR